MGYSMPLTLSGADNTVVSAYLPFGKAANRINLTNTGAVKVYFYPAWYPTLSDLTIDHVLDSGAATGLTVAVVGDGAFSTTVTAITNMDKAYLKADTTGKYYKIQSISLSGATATFRLVGNPLPDLTDTFSIVLMKPAYVGLNTWLDNTPLPWTENGWKFIPASDAAWSVEGLLICESK